jgi:hypothetical protein
LRDAQVLSQRLYPFPPVAGRWGYEGSFDADTRGTYPWYIAEMSQLARDAEGTPLYTWLLRLGAVGHVVALHTDGLERLLPLAQYSTLYPEPARLFRVPDPRPRAYLVSGARPGGTAMELAGAAATLDPAREVLLAGLSAPVAPDPAFRGAVHALTIHPDRVHAEIEASAPGWLVLVDAFDPGWRASVDGVAVDLLRANVAFRAVRVGSGRHSVDLVYRPFGVMAGLALSGLGVAVFAGLLLLEASPRPTRPTSAPSAERERR